MQAKLTLLTERANPAAQDAIESARQILENMSVFGRSGYKSPASEPSASSTPVSRSGIDCLDTSGRSRLHWAVWRGDLSTTNWLLRAGADPDVIGSDGCTPLFYATDTECAKAILDSGAKVNYSDPSGQTPVMVHFGWPDMISLLLSYGCIAALPGCPNSASTPVGRASKWYQDLTRHDERTRRWSQCVDLLISAGLDLNNPGYPFRQSPLVVALRNRNAPLVEILINKGALLDRLDADSNTIFHHAALSTQIECIEALRHAKINNVSPDQPNDNSMTPMDLLAARKRLCDENLGVGERRVSDGEFESFMEFIQDVRERRSSRSCSK